MKDVAGNALAANRVWSFTVAGPAPCTSNPIACENQKPGNPSGEWDVAGAGDPSIQGFGHDMSVAPGETIEFRIRTESDDYRLDIYRMGYYDGMGARKVDTVEPSAELPQDQPDCLTDDETHLYDVANDKQPGTGLTETTHMRGEAPHRGTPPLHAAPS